MPQRPIILIVDDVEDNRLVLKKTFLKEAYDFVEAVDGMDAYKKALMYSPSLIIMDLMMPGTNGFEAIDMIRGNSNIIQMPILALTASDSPEDKLRALRSGATDFITKPYDLTDLRARVHSLTHYHLSLVKKEEELREINNNLERKIQEKTAELKRQYLTDSLTLLPNRNKLIQDLVEEEALDGILLVDIDAFSEIANFYSREVSDAVLIELSRRISGICRQDHSCLEVYRLGGDVFAVTLHNDHIDTLVGNIVDNIHASPFTLFDDHRINVRVTVGAAAGREKVLNRAELALREAKSRKIDFQLYSTDNVIGKQNEENIRWTRQIIDAIEHDRITPYFQPIVNVTSGKTEKYECLIRLVDAEGTVHSPFHFMEIAKKSRLYPKLTTIMIEKACEAFKDQAVEFSINISSEDILNTTVREHILEILSRFPHPERIVFELLESDGIENYEAVIHFIDTVKTYGCKIALDDFGSGYSNFSHLLKLQADYIKIDGSLIKEIHEDSNSRIIVETIREFSSRLNLKTVAEFVHCQEVHDTVKAIGIDYVQGYHWGKPTDRIEV